MSHSSFLWMFIWPLGQKQKEENGVPDKAYVFLLGNKPEMLWLKKEALAKAMPPLSAKGPFPPHNSSELPLAEAEPEENEAAWTGPWPHSWKFWDLPGKQLNSGCLFNIFIFNSVTKQFKKCISRHPKKRLQCYTTSYVAWVVPALLNLSRHVILRRAWGEAVSQMEHWLTAMWNREQKDCHLQLETSKERIVSEFLCM